MKFTIVAATALLISPAAALAADLQAAPVASTMNWTGFYAGAYAGGSFGSNDLDASGGSTSVSLSPDGLTLGGLAGFNYQIGSVVLGGEGEFGYDGWKKGSDYLNARGGTRHIESEGSYIGRLRGRLGYAFDDLLVYSAAGVSFTNDKVTQSNPGSGISNSIDKALTGWNIGVGAEYAFGSNWTARLEYIYDDFGKKDYDFQALPGAFANREVHLEQNTVRVALSYRF